jgi:hypothetical protein
MNTRITPFRLIQGLFATAMIVTFGVVLLLALGIADARRWALVPIGASAVAALAALLFSLLWEHHRTHS